MEKENEKRTEKSSALLCNSNLENIKKHHNLVSRSRILWKFIKINSFRFFFTLSSQKHMLRDFLCISLHVSCRFLLPEHFSIICDCIICNVECTHSSSSSMLFSFFGVFVLFAGFFLLLFFISRAFSSTFYGILFSMQNWRWIKRKLSTWRNFFFLPSP